MSFFSDLVSKPAKVSNSRESYNSFRDKVKAYRSNPYVVAASKINKPVASSKKRTAEFRNMFKRSK